VAVVATTAKRVIDSSKFKGVLEITLALGNFMNSGHQLGDAAGFSIEGVLMLSGIKAGNKKISLMHYLAALVATKEPQVILGLPFTGACCDGTCTLDACSPGPNPLLSCACHESSCLPLTVNVCASFQLLGPRP
jgi:hypothetical protein